MAKKGKEKARAVEVVDDSEEEAQESALSDLDEDMEEDDTDPTVSRRSTRKKKPRMAYREISDEDYDPNEDVDMQEDDTQGVNVKQEAADSVNVLTDDDALPEEEPDSVPPLPPDFGIDEDEEEKRLKPKLQLSFRSLGMRDRCLCVVIEPSSALSHPAPAPTEASALDTTSRHPSVERMPPPERLTVSGSRSSEEVVEEDRREQTPLFLPDPSGRDRSATPALSRFPSELPTLETIEPDQDYFDDEFGMLAFSQALNNVSGDRVGAAEEDDEEMDSGALYGDADEIRGTIL